MYTKEEAGKVIIDLCRSLLDEKLVARTWGNVSARISDTQMLITPSGRAYETLTEDELVTVNISDCSYEGDIKPSSEKGIHAFIYCMRPDVNVVIHTHQFYASAVGAAGDTVSEAGTTIPCAGYGLPGTGKLKKAVADVVIANPDSDAFLMTRHGVLILAENDAKALQRAITLESQCRALFQANTCLADESEIPSGNKEKPWLDDYAQIALHTDRSKTDDADAYDYICRKNGAAAAYVKAAGGAAKPLGFIDSNVQHLIYKLKYSKLKNAGQKGTKS